MTSEPLDHSVPIVKNSANSPATVAEAKDRRRPGRRDDIQASLVDLLRGGGVSLARLKDIDTATDVPPDDRAPAIGIFAGALAGLVLWALAVGWML